MKTKKLNLSASARLLIEELKSMKGIPLKPRGKKWDAANELGRLGLVEWAPNGTGLLLKEQQQ
jgi:hypothetical protein